MFANDFKNVIDIQIIDDLIKSKGNLKKKKILFKNQFQQFDINTVSFY